MTTEEKNGAAKTIPIPQNEDMADPTTIDALAAEFAAEQESALLAATGDDEEGGDGEEGEQGDEGAEGGDGEPDEARMVSVIQMTDSETDLYVRADADGDAYRTSLRRLLETKARETGHSLELHGVSGLVLDAVYV